MKKSDLKYGMLVELRSGGVMLVTTVNGRDKLVDPLYSDKVLPLEIYNYDLTHVSNSYCDIVAVHEAVNVGKLQDEELKVIWKRPVPIPRDTPVWVSNVDNDWDWNKRHYSHYEDGIHYCFSDGKTSFTVKSIERNVTGWSFVTTEAPTTEKGGNN